MGAAVLKDVAIKRGLDIVVDSAATAGYHIGEKPDERAIATCRKFKIPMKHLARKVTQGDFDKFTHILAADESNLRDLKKVKPGDSTAEIRLWGSYLDDVPISDPYYGGIEGFEACLQQCLKLSDAFLDKVAPANSHQHA
jgi:low molecular weight phosphotyrosine protein phosphatase